MERLPDISFTSKNTPDAMSVLCQTGKVYEHINWLIDERLNCYSLFGDMQNDDIHVNQDHDRVNILTGRRCGDRSWPHGGPSDHTKNRTVNKQVVTDVGSILQKLDTCQKGLWQ